MKLFTTLINGLSQTNSSLKKTSLLSAYFIQETNELNKLWVIALLIGKKPPRTVNTTLLREWCAEEAGIPLWLFEQNYHIVGDLAETIALILPISDSKFDLSLHECITQIQGLKNKTETEKKDFVLLMWRNLDEAEKWIFNKLITGGFRIGVSKNIVILALAQALNVDKNTIAHHLMGDWSPEKVSWSSLFSFEEGSADVSRPYPFYLAHAISETDLSALVLDEWTAEWKWDGIRGQLIKRNGEVFLWSRGEELITDKFPEFEKIEMAGHDFVIDGEIIAWKDDKPMDFQSLQTRIGRKNVSKKLQHDTPVKIIAYDILEIDQKDIRQIPFDKRRKILENLVNDSDQKQIILSPQLDFVDLDTLHEWRNRSREIGAEGLMLKKKDGIYHTGRRTGEMWKWKVNPFTIDAVLIYAQRGHGRRANLFSDFTFALWEGEKLMPFAKAYSGLTDDEMKEITNFVKNNTLQTFGPVSSVKIELVFELAFEGVALSSRHKAGVAVRFPRILRWRKDKNVSEANKLDDLKELLK